jgi:hypothetical protein
VMKFGLMRRLDSGIPVGLVAWSDIASSIPQV